MEMVFERLKDNDLGNFRDFCREHWPGEHPLIHDPQMFEYYYRDADGGINFTVAREKVTRDIHSVLGFIKSNSSAKPDVWTSYILTKKGSEMGLGFKLLDFVQKLTNARTIASNNIRKKTRALYEFLGWYVGDQTQYYRLNEDAEKYTLCNIKCKKIPDVYNSSLDFRKIEDKKGLDGFEFAAFSEDKPYKDRHYFEKRFFDNPWLEYEVYEARDSKGPVALVVVRQFKNEAAIALRVVEYVGCKTDIAGCGGFLDRLTKERSADFCDWFSFGTSDETMLKAGFLARTDDDPNIIPFYLLPPVMENVTMSFFTNDVEGYTMFRADGDQDRPNLG